MQKRRLSVIASLAVLIGACSSTPQSVAPNNTSVINTTAQSESAESTKAKVNSTQLSTVQVNNIASGETAKSESNSDLPSWYLSPPKNTVTACAKVRGNDLNNARIIASAKAQAQYLETQQVSVSSETHITETASSKTGSQSTYNNKIILKTSGELSHHYGVKKQKTLEINNVSHLCVLYGVTSY